jgi:hypothetical protein
MYELGPLENLALVQRELETLAKRYAQLPERAPLLGPWADGMLRVDKLVASVQSRMPVALLGDQKVRSFATKVQISTSAVWNVYGRPMTLAARAPSAGGGSGAVSAAVSQGGGGDTDLATSDPHDADEPISDDDEDTS